MARDVKIKLNKELQNLIILLDIEIWTFWEFKKEKTINFWNKVPWEIFEVYMEKRRTCYKMLVNIVRHPGLVPAVIEDWK